MNGCIDVYGIKNREKKKVIKMCKRERDERKENQGFSSKDF